MRFSASFFAARPPFNYGAVSESADDCLSGCPEAYSLVGSLCCSPLIVISVACQGVVSILLRVVLTC